MHNKSMASDHGFTAAGSLVKTNMVPLFPRPIRTSWSTKVVSSHPFSLLPCNLANHGNRNPKSTPNPLCSCILKVSNDTKARLGTWFDCRNRPEATIRPHSKPMSLVTRVLRTSIFCWTTRLAVSTGMPAAETDPWALNLIVSTLMSPSLLLLGFQAFGKRSSSPTTLGEVYWRYQTPSRMAASFESDKSRGVGGKSCSRERTISNTFVCCSAVAVFPLFVNETASNSAFF